MTVDGIEHVFLRANAGKHFVALTYRLRRGSEVHNKHASCFLVELAEAWFLLTAGHWIKHDEHGLERLLSDGYAIDKIQLVDAFAGHTGSPLPFNFALRDWVAIYDDAEGIDFAGCRSIRFTVVAWKVSVFPPSSCMQSVLASSLTTRNSRWSVSPQSRSRRQAPRRR